VNLEERIPFEMQRLKEAGLRPTLKACTVLSDNLDPYRVVISDRQRKLAEWVADAFEQTRQPGKIHIRGVHYRFVGRVKDLNGALYVNDAGNWLLIQEAVAAARWCGLLPWDAIKDGRNAAADILIPSRDKPWAYLDIGEVEVELPYDLTPSWSVSGDFEVQPWQQIVIGEKQVLADHWLPRLCSQYSATCWLPTGEPSAQGLRDLLAQANEDGRKVAIHQIADADPAGWQMSISVARKVMALRDQLFPDLEVRVYAVALTPEQADAWDLPDSVLKETERRAGAWKAAHGREQTELDAGLALASSEFRKSVQAALAEHYSDAIETRNRETATRLTAEANKALEQNLGEERLTEIREAAERKLEELEELKQEINDALKIDPQEAGIPRPKLPEQRMGVVEPDMEPIYDSDDDWQDATRKLQGRKAYNQQD
jgi:hypothetical protein